MSDPFGTQPEGQSEREPNVYDDIFAPSTYSQKPEVYQRPDFGAPDTFQPQSRREARQFQNAPRSSEVKANAEPKTSKKAAPKRTRRVVDEDETPSTRSFRGVIIAAAITVVASLGFGVWGVVFALTNQDDTAAEVSYEAAMAATNVPGLPEGVTGISIEESPRVEVVQEEINALAADFAAEVEKLDLGSEFTSFDNPLQPVLGANEQESPAFSVTSKTYAINENRLNADEKQSVIDLANEYLVAQGFSEFDGSEVDFDSPQIFINGARQSNGGVFTSYSIVINTADNDIVQVSGVYITFYSGPHIKEGTEEEFRDYVRNSYAAVSRTTEGD